MPPHSGDRAHWNILGNYENLASSEGCVFLNSNSDSADCSPIAASTHKATYSHTLVSYNAINEILIRLLNDPVQGICYYNT
jgi:hypothetical protein